MEYLEILFIQVILDQITGELRLMQDCGSLNRYQLKWYNFA